MGLIRQVRQFFSALTTRGEEKVTKPDAAAKARALEIKVEQAKNGVGRGIS